MDHHWPVQSRCPRLLVVFVVLHACSSQVASNVGEGASSDRSPLRSVATEAHVLALLQAPGQEGAAVARACDPSEAAWLVSRGWWAAARELVQAFHREGDTKRQAALDSAVRREVGAVRRGLDGALSALNPQAYEGSGVVRCAFQWAQNSSAIFLMVKFSHRWMSPGALKLHGESMSVSNCCLNFSASGEHSQLLKRYALDLHFLRNVSVEGWSWQLASAGRLTVEIRKASAAVWPHLLHGSARPRNMASWESMQSKWASEVRDFQMADPTSKKKKKNKKRKDKGEAGDPDIAEVAEEERLDAMRGRCSNNASSPFFKDEHVHGLCEESWPPRMKGKKGRDTTWLVLFYSPREMKCDEHSSECTTRGSRWHAAAKKIRQVTSEAQVGAVNCDFHAAFCNKQEVGHLPYVRRYKNGKRKALYDNWDIDALMQFIRN